MNTHIIQNKVILREIINQEYNFTFLNTFKEYIDIEKYYNILQYVSYKNIINYMNIKWCKMKKQIDRDNLIEKINKCNCEQFDNILNIFINKEYALAIFVINTIIRYLS